MKSILVLVIIAFFITKFSNQEIGSGTGASAARRSVNIKQRKIESLDFVEGEINADLNLADSISSISR